MQGRRTNVQRQEKQGRIAGRYYIQGIYYGSDLEYDGNKGGLYLTDIDDLLSVAPTRDFYRITVSGIPNRDSPQTGGNWLGCSEQPPITRSLLKSDNDIENAIGVAYDNAGDAATAEDFMTALMNVDNTQWCRVDLIAFVDPPKSKGVFDIEVPETGYS